MKKHSFLTLALTASLAAACSHQTPQHQAQHQHGNYAGQEKRAIKALSDEEIASLTKGEGAGLAKAAELNGFPGPKHILENEAALALTAEQKTQVQQSFDKMKARAVELGGQIVEREKELDGLFRENRIDDAALREKTQSIAALQGDLRSAHLAAHLEMKKLLTPEQIAKYNELRGYKN